MDFVTILLIVVLGFSIYTLWLQSKDKKVIETELNRKLTWNEYKMVKRARNNHEKFKEKDSLDSNESLVVTDIVEPLDESEQYPCGTPIEIIESYERQSFDQMRAILQQIAYNMVDNNVSQEDKDEFKKIMTYFANRDPLYKDMIIQLIPIIAKQEGILQSKIYSYIPDYNPETIRYALYFAHELGDVKRVKKGRSYELFTPKYVKNEALEQ